MESHVSYDICFDKMYEILKNVLLFYAHFCYRWYMYVIHVCKMCNNESSCWFVNYDEEENDVEGDKNLENLPFHFNNWRIFLKW